VGSVGCSERRIVSMFGGMLVSVLIVDMVGCRSWNRWKGELSLSQPISNEMWNLSMMPTILPLVFPKFNRLLDK
jgi:hypothetical protein